MIDFKTLVPHNRTPWPRIKEFLYKKYEILDFFEISQYDFRPDVMSKFWERYQNFKFRHNQRIVVTQYDVQFYLPESKISLGLYNLFLIFNYYNIPTDFLIFLISDDSESEIRLLAKYFNLPKPNGIAKILHFEEVISSKYQNFVDVNVDKIKKSFICLNGVQRPHKIDFLCLLEEKKILDKTLHSYNFGVDVQEEYHKIDEDVCSNYPNLKIGLIHVDPIQKSNERYVKNLQVTNAYLKHKEKFMYKNFRSELIDRVYIKQFFQDDPLNLNNHFIQNAGIKLVTETAMNYPYPLITEKTWKAIVYSRPFIIIGPVGCIDLLKQYGFETFDSFWDESYDNILDTSQRLCYIANIVENLAKLSLTEIKDIVIASQKIFEHNLNNYINNFGTIVIDNIIKKLESND